MGLTVLDSGVLIGFLDSNDAHHPASLEVFTDAHAGNDRLVLPASALAEILVGPSRRGTASWIVCPSRWSRLVRRSPLPLRLSGPVTDQ